MDAASAEGGGVENRLLRVQPTEGDGSAEESRSPPGMTSKKGKGKGKRNSNSNSNSKGNSNSNSNSNSSSNSNSNS